MTNTALSRIDGDDFGFDPSKVQLIKNMVAVGATDNELALFLYTAQRTGLDPLARQIYCIKRQGKMTIQAGIDGYRLIADRTGKYAGNDDPVFGPDQQIGNTTAPESATVTVWKIVSGIRCPFTSTARWSEYYPGDSQGFMWRKMPYLMLGKCAESLALRKAFPAELSGVYTDAEMDQAGTIDVAPPAVDVIHPQQTINANLRRKADVTAEQARDKFYERFGPALAHPETDPSWVDVRRTLNLPIDAPEPTTVEGWRDVFLAVRDVLQAEAQRAA